MNRLIPIRIRRQSWAIAAGFLIAFCWLGFAAVRFRSIFEGVEGMMQSLPAANRFALTYGPIAFPMFGIIAAAVFILADVFLPKSWMHWALVVLFALLIGWSFRALLVGGVFMVPTTRAKYPAGGNTELALWFAIGNHWLGVPQPGRYV